MGNTEWISEKVHFYVFGPPRLEKAGQAVLVDTRKALALLAYLALGKTGSAASYTRDGLAALLYPESDTTSARAALRRTLSALRKGIGSQCVETDGERLELKRETVWVDVLVFRDLLTQTRLHGHSPAEICSECLPLLERCAGLAEAGFLSGFSLRDSPSFDDWQSYQEEALRQEQAWVLEKLSLGLAAQADFEPSLHYARRWLALDPLYEDAHRHMMRLHAWKGQRSASLRQYRDCVRILEQELGVPPLEETQRLYKDLLENRIPPLPQLALFHPASGPPAPSPEREGMRTTSTHPLAVRGEASADLPSRVSVYPLVGRTNEMRDLLEAYQGTGEKGFLFVIHGEPGIGKSRLAADFLQQAQARQAPVMQVRCYEGQSGLAYAPFLDGLNTLLNREDAVERLQVISPSALSLAAQLAPALAEIFPDLPAAASPQSQGIQVRFFDALRQVLRALLASPVKEGQPAGGPGVLFLDDLHWADPASLDLLAYLARRLEGAFILATWRSGSVPPDHMLRHLLVQGEREGRAASLRLDRLRPQDVDELLELISARLPEHLKEHLYHETEGSPFFLTEYLDVLLPDAAGKETPSWDIPPGVRGLLQTHLDNAGELGRQILSAAAVLGRSFDYAILHEVSGRSELETVEGLEQLLQQGLLVEAPGSSAVLLSYDFSHEKLCNYVYDQTSQARRRLLHQRCGDAYASRARHKPETAALVAVHYQHAGQLLKAAEWFRQAGEYARSVYANREAIAHFQNALACGHPDTAGLQESTGDLYMLSGSYPAALESYQSAAASCSTQHLPWVEHKLGLVYDQRGEWELAECYFKSALEYLEENAPVAAGSGGETNRQATDAEKSMIFSDWSRAAYRKGDLTRAQELASQALKLAVTGPYGPSLAQAYNNLGILARAAGKVPEAVQHLQRSLEISRNLGDQGLQAAALNNLARVYVDSEHPEQAFALTHQALEICQQRGDRHREAALYNNLADLHHSLGQEELSHQYLTRAVVIMAEIGGEPLGEPQPEIWKLVEW